MICGTSIIRADSREEKMKPKIINLTHDDLDGAVCAYLVHKFHEPGTVQSIPCTFKDLDEKLIEFASLDTPPDIILVTDMCPKLSTLRRFESVTCPKIDIIDHHATSIAIVNACPKFTSYCLSPSMAEGLSNLLGEPFTPLIEATSAWDGWLLNSPHRKNGERLNLLFKYYGFHDFLGALLLHGENIFNAAEELMDHLEAKEQAEIEEALKGRREYGFDGCGNKWCALLECSVGIVSKAAHEVLEREPSVDYVMAPLPEIGSLSYRSRDGGVDVSEIAKANGGGGHHSAAGHPLSDELKAYWGGLDVTMYRDLKFISDDLDLWGEGKFDSVIPEGFEEVLLYPNHHFPEQGEGIKCGIYSGMSGHSFQAGSYSGYGWFREILCECMNGCIPEYVWQVRSGNREKAYAFRFAYLISFSDCEGVLNHETCIKLHSEFTQEAREEFVSYVAKEFCDDKPYQIQFTKKWDDWMKVFKEAAKSPDGVVVFS